ncbi:hypothetical protein HDU97_005639 [Phlyctochytrium planicorne]|nr:hypothetical protein HDU97_005639 [Phlyctochytrium planicorne]
MLSGNIPSSLAALTSLEVLDLSTNLLDGSIPAFISGYTNLQKLFLGPNQFEGSLPDVFGNLKSLTAMRFAQNRLSGDLPIIRAIKISLYDNYFTGDIPDEDLLMGYPEISNTRGNCLSQYAQSRVRNLDPRFNVTQRSEPECREFLALAPPAVVAPSIAISAGPTNLPTQDSDTSTKSTGSTASTGSSSPTGSTVTVLIASSDAITRNGASPTGSSQNSNSSDGGAGVGLATATIIVIVSTVFLVAVLAGILVFVVTRQQRRTGRRKPRVTPGGRPTEDVLSSPVSASLQRPTLASLERVTSELPERLPPQTIDASLNGFGALSDKSGPSPERGSTKFEMPSPSLVFDRSDDNQELQRVHSFTVPYTELKSRFENQAAQTSNSSIERVPSFTLPFSELKARHGPSTIPPVAAATLPSAVALFPSKQPLVQAQSSKAMYEPDFGTSTPGLNENGLGSDKEEAFPVSTSPPTILRSINTVRTARTNVVGSFSTWSVEEVAQWLYNDIGVRPDVVGMLRASNLNGPQLVTLTEADLIAMGVQQSYVRTSILGAILDRGNGLAGASSDGLPPYTGEPNII